MTDLLLAPDVMDDEEAEFAPASPAFPAFPHLASQEEADARAKAVAERHRRGLERNRPRHLLADKYAAHVSGEMWVDIANGALVRVPQAPGSARGTINRLDLMVANMVAYHTSSPFRFLAVPRADLRDRQLSVVSTAIANDIAETQRLNQLTAAALSVGAVYGYGSIRVVWRDDLSTDPYPAVMGSPDASVEVEQGWAPVGVMRRGFADLYLGDPWSEVHDKGATRTAVHRESHTRIVPMPILKAAFAQAAGVEGMKPARVGLTASRYQRIQRAIEATTGWNRAGSLAVDEGTEDDPQGVLIVEETAPGIEAEWPTGRLSIVALDGGDAEADGGAWGRPVLMHEGPLPGGVMSGERLYPSAFSGSGDDVLGSPWVHNLVPLNQTLNIVYSQYLDWCRKWSRPPILANMGLLTIEHDGPAYDGGSPFWNNQGGQSPAFLAPPQGQGEIMALIDRIVGWLDTQGGYQAASQGQMKSGVSGFAVRQLAAYDDTIFGTAATGIADALCSLMRKCYAVVRTHLTVPWLLRTAGGDSGYLASPFIHRAQLSDEAPNYQLVSSKGTIADRIAELDKLVVMADAAGTPILTASDYQRVYPDRSLFPLQNEVAALKRRRALGVNAHIRDAVEVYRQETGTEPGDPSDAEAAALILEQMNREPRTAIRRDDDVAFHIETLSEITQDGESDPLAVSVAEGRQDAYYEMQRQAAVQQAAQAQTQQPQGAQQEQQPQQAQAAPQQGITQEQQAQGSSDGMMQAQAA